MFTRIGLVSILVSWHSSNPSYDVKANIELFFCSPGNVHFRFFKGNPDKISEDFDNQNLF